MLSLPDVMGHSAHRTVYRPLELIRAHAVDAIRNRQEGKRDFTEVKLTASCDIGPGEVAEKRSSEDDECCQFVSGSQNTWSVVSKTSLI